MSKNLFLIKYQDNNHYDDTSETLERAYLKEEIHEKLQEYLNAKEIPEAKGFSDRVSIDYSEEDNINDIIKYVLIPECIRASEEIDKKIIDSKIVEEKILSLGVLVNVLKLLILKRDEYKDNPNVLLIVG